MANQKQYSIIINGVKESINEIDVLINQLDKLEKKLSNMEKKVVKVNVEEVQSSKKTKSTPSTNSGLSAIEKEQLKNEKLKSEEYQKQLQTLQALKEENKQLEKLNKDIANGVRNIDGSYTNTLEGMRRKLSDMKKELASMDMSDVDGIENFAIEINELNEKIKGVEQSYGTFSRNVGNYTDSMVDALNEFDGQMYETAGGIEEVVQKVDSLKGKQLFEVNLGGTVVQFENISQAIGEIDDMAHATAARMQELRNAGKQNTEEYKKLNAEFQEFIQQSAELERVRKQTDELRDSIASSTRGLDMGVQAFQALGNAMQMASGIAGLFGQNQEEIEKAINRTVQIMGIMQAAQELYQQTVQKGTVLNILYSNTFGKINQGLTRMVSGLNLGTKATKALNTVLKANIFVAIASAILYVVTNLDKLSEILGITSEETKTFTKLWEKVSPIIMGVGRVVTDSLINPIRTLVKTMAELLDGDFKGALEELGKGFKEQFNVIEDFHKGYNDEIIRQQENVTKKQKIELEKQLLHEKEFNEAKYGSDWKYTNEGIELYRRYFAAKLALYDKDSEEYRQALLEQISFERELKEHQENGGSSGDGKSKADIQKEIDDNTIAAMKEGFKKQQEERNLQYKRERDEAIASKVLVKEQLAAIDAKYKRINEDALQEYYDSIADIIKTNEDEISQYIIDNQKNLSEVLIKGIEYEFEKYSEIINTFNSDLHQFKRDVNGNLEFDIKGVNKTEAQLHDFVIALKTFKKENEDAFKLDFSSFKNGFSSMGKVIGNTFKVISENIKLFYGEIDTELLKNKLDENLIHLKEYTLGIEEYYDLETKQTEAFVKAEEETLQALVDITKDKMRENYLLYINGFASKNQYEAVQMSLEYQLKAYEQDIKDFKEYGEIKVKEHQKYIGNFIGKLYQEQAERRKIEKANYDESVHQQDEWLTERLKQLSKAEELELQNINLTEEEKDEIEKRYNKEGETARKEYTKRIETITKQHQQNLLKIDNETNSKRSDVLQQYHNAVLQQYQGYYDKLNSMIEKNSNANDVNMGSQDLNVLGDISQFVYKKAKFEDEFRAFKDDIVKQKDELRQQLKDGVISQEVFDISMGNLNLLEEQTDETLSSMSKSFIGYTQSVAALAQSAVNIWAQMYSQIADLQYQNEMYRIEKLQEQYDEETEILQEKLEEQEELYEKHNQNVESIEGELQTARGDRRLFLLDQINSEMMKREQAWAQQQKIAKQQEQLEKKKEALEERQKAAEQKRNKQNQKVQIAQATASTALAVTNALSVQPWFVRNCLGCCCCCDGCCSNCYYCKTKIC